MTVDEARKTKVVLYDATGKPLVKPIQRIGFQPKTDGASDAR